MNFMQSDNKSILVLFIIYMIANSFLFLNYNGIYWDDWALYGHSFETINNMFLQVSGNAAYPMSLLHYSLLNMGNGVFIYRLLTVVLLFLSGIFIYKILKNINILSSQDRFIIVLFMLLAPLYSAKIALIDFPYTLFSTIFFFAFYILAKNINDLSIATRIFVLILFFSSFLTNSLLVFYAVPLGYILYISYDKGISFSKNIIQFIKIKLDFIILPIVFIIIKSIYFVPNGLYQNYNKIDLASFTNSIWENFEQTFLLSFKVPILQSIDLLNYWVIFFIFLILLIMPFLDAFKEKNQGDMSKNDSYLFIMGLVIFLLGSFPYLVVGKIPQMSDWESRHQLLLPLGFSLIVYFGIKLILNILSFKQIAKFFLYFILILSFIIFHIKDNIFYNIDSMYQQSIIENFRQSDTIRNNSTFIYSIELNSKFVRGRTLRFYEINGLSKEAFKVDNRLFSISKEEIFINSKFKDFKQYNFSCWDYSTPFFITISDNLDSKFNKGKIQSIIFLLKLKYWEIFNNDKFRNEVKKLVTMKIR